MADDFMNGFLAGQGDNNRGGLFGGDGGGLSSSLR